MPTGRLRFIRLPGNVGGDDATGDAHGRHGERNLRRHHAATHGGSGGRQECTSGGDRVDPRLLVALPHASWAGQDAGARSARRREARGTCPAMAWLIWKRSVCASIGSHSANSTRACANSLRLRSDGRVPLTNEGKRLDRGELPQRSAPPEGWQRGGPSGSPQRLPRSADRAGAAPPPRWSWRATTR